MLLQLPMESRAEAGFTRKLHHQLPSPLPVLPRHHGTQIVQVTLEAVRLPRDRQFRRHFVACLWHFFPFDQSFRAEKRCRKKWHRNPEKNKITSFSDDFTCESRARSFLSSLFIKRSYAGVCLRCAHGRHRRKKWPKRFSAFIRRGWTREKTGERERGAGRQTHTGVYDGVASTCPALWIHGT